MASYNLVICSHKSVSLHYLSGSWRYIPPRKSKVNGTQIDLIFDRADHAITLCEIKYSHKPFVIEKSYAKILNQKKEIFEAHYPNKKNPTHKQILLAMITTEGVKKNMYSEDLVDHEVILDDLFA